MFSSDFRILSNWFISWSGCPNRVFLLFFSKLIAERVGKEISWRKFMIVGNFSSIILTFRAGYPSGPPMLTGCLHPSTFTNHGILPLELTDTEGETGQCENKRTHRKSWWWAKKYLRSNRGEEGAQYSKDIFYRWESLRRQPFPRFCVPNLLPVLSHGVGWFHPHRSFSY